MTPPTTPSGQPVPTVSRGRVVVLVSGAGSNLGAILSAHEESSYGARVVAVVSDRADAGGLTIAREAGIATAVVQPQDFPDRAAWDEALAATVVSFRPDLVVSAGFMRVLGAPYLAAVAARTLNTHPALLPSFPGAHGVRDALAYGVRVTGCTVHVVDAGVDSGPIVAQRTVAVLDDDDEATLHERIKVVEREVLVDVVGRACRDGLVIEGRQARLGR